VERLFRKSLDGDKPSSSVVVQCLRRRVPVHFGGVSDPLQPAEEKYKLTLRVLALLKHYDYPTIISSKSHLLLGSQYLELLDDMKVAVQVTLTTSNERIAKALEPKAPSVRERLVLLSKLSDKGIWTSCRFQPLIPRVSSDDLDLIDLVADSGCRHVAIEHYKLPTYASRRRKQKMAEACSFEIEGYYRDQCPRPRGMFFEIPTKEKLRNLRPIVRRIHQRKMTYGAADNDLHHLGDDVCCCGVGCLEGFEHYYKYHNAKAVFDGKYSGKIFYSSIKQEWRPTGSVREVLNRKSRMKSSQGKGLSSVSDYVRMKWNTPFSNNSPTDMVNVLPTDEYDDEGNLVYGYQDKLKLD